MDGLRSQLRRLRATAHESLGANRRTRERLDGSSAVVLGYHRVLPHDRAQSEGVEPGMYVTPETFRNHLRWLREHFEVLPLGEIVARVADGQALPRRACAITFDDGWRDNYEHAWPALRDEHLPATIFVVTSRVGTQGAFWPDAVWRTLAALPRDECRARAIRVVGSSFSGAPSHAVLDHLKRLDEIGRERAMEVLGVVEPAARPRELLDWVEVAEMAREGIEFESHAATHAILTGLPQERVASELISSLGTLRARGLARSALFAYPSGALDAAVIEAVRVAGFRAAFTTQPGLISKRTSHLEFPRVLLHEDVSSTAAEFLYRVPGRRGLS